MTKSPNSGYELLTIIKVVPNTTAGIS